MSSAPPTISYIKLFNWATALSKCATEERIVEFLTLDTKRASYTALVAFSNCSFVGDYESTLPDTLISRPNTPVKSVVGDEEVTDEDTNEITPKTKGPTVRETPGQNETPVQNETPRQIETPAPPPTETPAPPPNPNKRKPFNPNDHTATKKLLEAYCDSRMFVIGIYKSEPLTKIELHTDIKVQLAKCNNSIGNTNEARYKIASHLLNLTEYTPKDKVKSSFYTMIGERFKIQPR